MDLYELLEITQEEFNMDLLKKQYHKMCLEGLLIGVLNI
jgi:hypothetical protein